MAVIVEREEATTAAFATGTLVDVVASDNKLALGLVPGYALKFAGGITTDNVQVADAAAIQNIFDGGGTIEAIIRPDGMGGVSLGRVYDKAQHVIHVSGESGGKCRLVFFYSFSLASGGWQTTDRVITLGQIHTVKITYNADSTANNPAIEINGAPVGVTQTLVPSGTRVSDAGSALFIGNSSARTTTFDGLIDELRLWKGGNLAWYSKFNTGSGTVLVDEINANNGAITGATWVEFDSPYKSSGYKIWLPLNLSAVITAWDSSIEFTKSTPVNTDLKVYALLTDTDAVPAHNNPGWSEQASGTALTVVAEGMNVDGKRLWLKAVLSTADASVTPSLSRWYARVAQFTKSWLDISLAERTGLVEYERWPEAGQTVLIRDPDGDLISFCIVEVDLSIHGVNTRTARCEHLFYELADGPVRSYNLVNAIPSTALAAALNGTRWTVGNIDAGLAALTKNLQGIYLNPLEMLRLIEREYEARLKFRVTVNGAGITAYLVDLLEIDEEFKGRRFEFGWDLQGIDIKVDHSNIKTALVGVGLGDEIDLATGEPLPLTFKDAVWSKADGDPANKPLGQDWVGNEDARLLYGIYDPATGEMRHRFRKYDSQAETPEGLLQATWLIGTRYHFRPQVNIEAPVADLEQVKIADIVSGGLVQLSHEKIRLGNVCYVLARDKGVIADLDVKILRVERHLKDPEQTRVIFGDPIILGSDYLRELEADVNYKDKRRRKLDRGRGPATVIVASEDTSRMPWYANIIVPAGATNAQEYIMQAIDLLPSFGGQVVLQEGAFVVSAPIIITKHNVSVKGQGQSTRIVAADNVNDLVYIEVFADEIKIADLALDGLNRSLMALRSSPAVKLAGFALERCIVENFMGMGVRLDNHDSPGVFNNVFKNNGDLFGNFLLANSNDYIVNGNTFIQEREAFNFMVFDSLGGSISGNTVFGGYSGIPLSNCHNATVSANSIRFVWRGISIISSSSHNTLTGNSIDNAGVPGTPDGIYIVGGFNNTVSGNSIVNNTNGIFIGSSNHNSIQANKCTKNMDYGIRISSGTGNLVTNNDLFDNGIGALLDNGTGTVTAAGNRS